MPVCLDITVDAVSRGVAMRRRGGNGLLANVVDFDAVEREMFERVAPARAPLPVLHNARLQLCQTQTWLRRAGPRPQLLASLPRVQYFPHEL